jgi:GTPase SAR1 family protein
MSTVGLDLKSKVVTACGKRIKCDVWDTAGQERYRSITKSYYRKALLTVGLTVASDAEFRIQNLRIRNRMIFLENSNVRILQPGTAAGS